ncbi:MAG TPA: NAD+ synthase [Desulfomonilaceae bacterium]|nr:NAD+ synthase [Desulfomonilaceae bacterium]
MPLLRIAQAQVNLTVGDFRGNLEKIGDWIVRARVAGADIVTFPELALCGYPPEDLLLRPRFLLDNRLALNALAPKCTGILVLVGFADTVNDKVANAAALIGDGLVQDVYHKIELPNYGVFDEKRYFHPGSRCMVLEISGVRIAVTICEDIWIEGSVTEACAIKNDAQITLNISGSPFYAGKLAVRTSIVTRFARATNTILCYNNLVGGQDELIFDGGSMVVDSKGTLVARAKRFEEDLFLTDLNVDALENKGPLWDICGTPKLLLFESPTDRSYTAPSIEADLSRIEEIYKALVLGTRDYVRKNGFKKVLIGLSGGIDSALTAAIAVEALGRENVIGVTMPSEYTSTETLSDAAILAENLSIELITLPINRVFGAYLSAMEGPLSRGKPSVDLENLQARIRGNMLMALSNRFGWLVLTTGNKSETAVGYSTLYGDTAGGFAVVKDVPKTVVYELSEYINRKAGKELIPRSVIERAPSAELRPDQKDEDSLPPYSVLDPILRAYVEEDKAPEDINGFDPALVEEVARMVDRNEYKRRQAPPGIKITPKAFGKDWRLPITNRYIDGKMKEKT